MFKFDEYPELKKAHEEYARRRDEIYKIDDASDDPDDPQYWNLRKIQDNFKFNIYAKAVFDAFNPIKPVLRDVWEKNKPCTWEEIIGDNFDECDEDKRGLLFGMVEEEDPYILPAEYYTGKTEIELYFEGKARSQE